MDITPGDAIDQGVDGVWFVSSPQGKKAHPSPLSQDYGTNDGTTADSGSSGDTGTDSSETDATYDSGYDYGPDSGPGAGHPAGPSTRY
jgi:hypothetical protein